MVIGQPLKMATSGQSFRCWLESPRFGQGLDAIYHRHHRP